MPPYKLLKHTENYLSTKVRLPVLKDEMFYPTEASVELEPLHPGEPNIIGTCMRAAYYRYMGGFTGEAFSSYTQWIFLTGKAVEAELVEMWKQMGIWKDNNIKFRSKKHHISGEFDAVLLDPTSEEDNYFICEVKTYWGYEATKSIGGNPKKGIAGQPKDAHLLQVLLYLDLHKHVFKQAKLVYIDKTCKDNFEFDITLAEEGSNTYPVINGIVNRRFSVQQIYERFAKLKQYTENKVLPPRDFEMTFSEAKIEREFADGNISKTKYENHVKKGLNIGSWSCNYCRYSNECYGKQVTADDDE